MDRRLHLLGLGVAFTGVVLGPALGDVLGAGGLAITGLLVAVGLVLVARSL